MTPIRDAAKCFATLSCGYAAILQAFLLVGYFCLPSGGAVEEQSSRDRRLRLSIYVPDYDAGDPILNGVTIPDNAWEVGMWTKLFPWPLVSIHAAVLPNGKVLTFGTKMILD